MADHKLRPLEDRLLVEAISEMESTVSGIIIPDSVKKGAPKKAKVLATGKGRHDNDGKLVPMEVKVGDTVLLKDWGASEVKLNGKELFIVSEQEVLAILE